MARLASEIIYKLIADDAALTKSFKDAETRAEKLGKSFTNAGKKLTIGLTLPIAAAATAFIKLASDAEETNSKFDAVFKDQADTVREWATEYSRAVGRSTTENIGFLATIQDTLVPLGLTRDAAAEVSKSVVELSTDLASFNNLPTEQVVRDIQSALVGNTETLRKYGVVASQEAIVQEALTSGLIDQANELTATTKAQAIYNLLVQGTSDAQGDAARTAGSAANQLRALQSEAKQLGEEFGQQLLPIFVDIVGNLRDLIGNFSALDEEQKRTILTVGALVAAIGPLLTITGKIITILPALKTGFLLLTGPVGLAVAGVTALGVGIAILIGKNNDLKNQKVAEIYEGIAEAAGLAGGELRRINEAFEANANFNPTLQRSTVLVNNLASEFGKTREEIVQILLVNENISGEAREQLNTISRLNSFYDDELELVQGISSFTGNMESHYANIAKDAERTAGALEAQREQQEAIQAIVDQRYLTARERVLEVLGREKTELDRITDQILELQKTPWAAGRLEDDRLKALQILRERQQSLIDENTRAEIEANQKIIDEQNQAYTLATQARQDLEFVSQEEIDRIRAQNAEREKSRQKELLDAQKDKWTQALGFARQYASAVQGFSDAITNREIDNIEKSSASEEEKAQKIASLKRRQAIFDKAVTITQIVIETARSVVAALPNLVLAGITGSLGAIQLAGAIAQPIPTFATGGSFTVPQGFQNDSFPLAFAQSDERVTVETPAQAASSDGRRGNTFIIETVVASPGGLRELNRLLNKYGNVESLRMGV
jgi:hypothetical protein